MNGMLKCIWIMAKVPRNRQLVKVEEAIKQFKRMAEYLYRKLFLFTGKKLPVRSWQRIALTIIIAGEKFYSKR
jgi:hypothetical protein